MDVGKHFDKSEDLKEFKWLKSYDFLKNAVIHNMKIFGSSAKQTLHCPFIGAQNYK